MPKNSIVTNGKKFMWDGIEYESREQSSKKLQKYKDNGFEVETVDEDGKTFLYTRRVIKEVVIQST